MGGKHGLGTSTVASISASPVEVAVKLSVLMLTTLGLPVPSILWQLKIARKLEIGFVPAKGPAARTNPRRWTSSSPFDLSSPCPVEILHGNPPPLTPRL